MRRRLLLWALALVASAAFALRGVPPSGDALRSTLIVLPLVVAALWEIARCGRPLPGARRLAQIEMVGLALLVALALGREHLGLAGAEEVIVAGLFVLLLAAAVRLGLSLRPLLGRALPERPPWPFFALPLVVYLAVLPWSAEHRPPDGDEPFYLLVTRSLAYDGDAELTNDYRSEHWREFMTRAIEPQPGDPRGPQGEIYSRHNLLLPLALVPAYRLAGVRGAQAMMALCAAALAWSTVRLARHYLPRRPGAVLLAWLALALASPLLLYSYQVWVEVPAALLCTLALEQIRKLGRDRLWHRRRWFGIAVPLLLLPLLKIRFLLLAVPLLGLAWWHAGRPRKPLVVLALALLATSGAMLLHNRLVYGNVLKIHQWQELELLGRPLDDYLRGASGLGFDAAFGLVGAAPLWLVLLALVRHLRWRPQPLLFDAVVFGLPYAIVVFSRGEWYGGWSPPFRYALVALPLLAIALARLLDERRRQGARWLLGSLGLLTAGLTVVWLVVPGWTYNLANGSTYLLDRLGASLGADVARLFPSSVRPRLATWLWPVLATAVVALLWRWPRRRAPRALAEGAALGLLLLAAVPLAARVLPTQVVELEDPWVQKTGGHVFPPQWIIERTRYRGAWVLREGEQAEVPLVAGGRELSVRVVVEWVRNSDSPLELELRSGARVLARHRPRTPGQWADVTLGPFPWRPGERLVLAAVGPPGAPPRNGLSLDRLELDWR